MHGRRLVFGGSIILSSGCEEIPRTYSTEQDQRVVIFQDSFNRSDLGPDWNPTGPGAKLERGVLKVEDLRNHPLWLNRPLPPDVRIEFDAWATTDEGDIKIELAGDGHSAATSANYIATGYVVIFGGWNNQLNAIVRRNEHGADRQTTAAPNVEPGQRYHFAIARAGREIHWELNGQEILSYDDDTPLHGEGHDHFAFSGWEAQVHFDNLVIEAL